MPRISQPITLLFGTILALVAFWTYGKLYFYQDPGSLLFFDPSRAYDRKYSTYREKEILEYRKDVIENIEFKAQEKILKSRNDPEVCAVIVSVDRKIDGLDIHPLELTLLSATSNLSPAERQSLHIQVYIAHLEPSEHSLWHSPLLKTSKHIVDGVSTPVSLRGLGKNLDRLKSYEQEHNLNAKTALDFSFALQSCLDEAPSAKYVALIEGDVIFAEGWYARALAGVKQIENMKDGHKKTWSDLRLFYPESNTGWAERRWFGNHVPHIILVVDAILVAVVMGMRQSGLRYNRQLAYSAWPSPAFLAVLCLITVPISIVTIFAAGKSSLATLFVRPGVHQQNWGCCTQTIFFPSRNIGPLINTFQTRTEETSPDWMLMQHAKREALTRYVLNPVLVQHRGAMSSIISPERDAKRAEGLLWSVSFENLDPKRLKSEHRQTVNQIFSEDST